MPCLHLKVISKSLRIWKEILSESIESVPVIENEISEDVFSNVLDMCKKGNINISENHIDHAHRIGKPYVDNTSKKQCKSIIARFTSFQKRTS